MGAAGNLRQLAERMSTCRTYCTIQVMWQRGAHMERGLTERDRAKLVICAIIDAMGGAVNGKLRLYKAFYYSHIVYFQSGPGIVLTGYPIVKMPLGPGIDNAAE